MPENMSLSGAVGAGAPPQGQGHKKTPSNLGTVAEEAHDEDDGKLHMCGTDYESTRHHQYVRLNQLEKFKHNLHDFKETAAHTAELTGLVQHVVNEIKKSNTNVASLESMLNYKKKLKDYKKQRHWCEKPFYHPNEIDFNKFDENQEIKFVDIITQLSENPLYSEIQELKKLREYLLDIDNNCSKTNGYKIDKDGDEILLLFSIFKTIIQMAIFNDKTIPSFAAKIA